MLCPISFSPYGGGCIRTCPAQSGFEQRTDGGQAKCVYTADPTKLVRLVTITGFPGDSDSRLPVLTEIQQADPPRYELYKAESDRVDAALAVILSDIGKKTQIDTAFKSLQDAENTRDQNPDAYGLARIAYYSLVRGPEWIETERARVTATEVDPVIARYRGAFDDVAFRLDTQRRTQDVMNSVKEGVLSLKDDVQYTTDTFKKQLDTLKNQINIERRGRDVSGDDDGFFTWIDLILNISIIAGLIFAGLTFWRKLSAPTASSMYTPSVYPPGFVGPRLPYL